MRSGFEVLEHLRQSPKSGHIPVIVVTSSDSQHDRKQMARFGVSHYFRKPTSYNEFIKLGGILKNVLGEERNIS